MSGKGRFSINEAMNIKFETDRLILREFHSSDAIHFFNLNQDPDVIKYTGDFPFKSIMDAKKFLERYPDYLFHGFGRWAVILKSTGEFIGWCGLKSNEEGLVDLGFRFFRNHWNKGFATEAARATLHYGFNTLGLTQIIGRSAVENKASIRVLEKINMQFWKNGACDGIQKAVYYRIHKQD